MSSKIISDITRLVTTSADPTLFGSVEFVDALNVIGLRKAMDNARAEYEIARVLRLVKKMKRAKKVLEVIRARLMKRSAKLLRMSKLNPKAPSWVPRPKMLRYHAVLFVGVPNVLCAKQ